MIINVCKDFTETPGARYRSEGKFSGEEFRDDILVPKFDSISSSDEKITIELDGGYGYPTSFLEEAFGGLARIYGSKAVKEKLLFVSNDEPSLIDEITSYIEEAKKE